MSSSKEIDCYQSYKIGEQIIEFRVKKGLLSKEKAALILKEAKKNYRNQSYNRELAKIKRIENG